MKIRIWTTALALTAFCGVALGEDAAKEGSAGMDQFRAEAMAGIHAENRAALERQLHETQNALRVEARDSLLAQQPVPATGRPTAKSAP